MLFRKFTYLKKKKFKLNRMDSFPISIIINTTTATHPVTATPFHIIFKSEKMPISLPLEFSGQFTPFIRNVPAFQIKSNPYPETLQ